LKKKIAKSILQNRFLASLEMTANRKEKKRAFRHAK